MGNGPGLGPSSRKALPPLQRRVSEFVLGGLRGFCGSSGVLGNVFFLRGGFGGTEFRSSDLVCRLWGFRVTFELPKSGTRDFWPAYGFRFRV